MTITQQDRQLAERIVLKAFTHKADDWRWDMEIAASLLAEAREAQHKASWLPIVTAPKDWSVVMLADCIGQVTTGYWDGKDECWMQSMYVAIDGATHWMPLPTPPITNEGE